MCLLCLFRRALTLVCRRWHRLVWTEPRLWHHFSFPVPPASPGDAAERHAQWLAATRRTLGRVGAHVRSASADLPRLHKACAVLPDELCELLSLLPAHQLEALDLGGFYCGRNPWSIDAAPLAPLAVAALSAFPRLTSLSFNTISVPPAAAGLPAGLTRLRRLRLLPADGVPASVFSAAAGLAQLRELQLAGAAFGGDAPAVLERLHQALPLLEHLDLSLSTNASLAPPCQRSCCPPPPPSLA
jgi:hypothetical protein